MKIVFKDDHVQNKPEEVLTLIRVPAGFGCDEMFVGETPITEAQWVDVMGGSILRGANYPKTNVSFAAAQEFCKRASTEQYELRLPSEVEFCRFVGAEPTDLEKYAVFKQDNIREVKTKLPNEYGLYDVRGLVWEWLNTDIHGDKVLLGGSWRYARLITRAVARYDLHAAIRGYGFGFRVVVCRPPSS